MASSPSMAAAAWLCVFLLAGTSMAARKPMAVRACTKGCTMRTSVVCASNGQSYHNECVAGCARQKVAHRGYCKGTSLRFVQGTRESAAVVDPSVMNAFATEGFHYAGRVNLVARSPAPATESALAAPHVALKAGEVAQVMRYTPTGDVYIASYTVPDTTNVSIASVSVLAPIIPASLRVAPIPRVPSPGDTDDDANAASLPKAGRRLARAASIIGQDQRQDCMRLDYPYTAVGQLEFEIEGAEYICSGALYKPQHVLTAGHCVWDENNQGFVEGILFAPGRYRTSNGTVVDPFGTVKWEHITVMSAYKASNAERGDMAVIKLAQDIAAKTGTLGIKAACAEEKLQVIIAGYPSDKPDGQCDVTTCMVDYKCTDDATTHTCDTIFGMSGSAVYDSEFNIRGTHVRGMMTYNEFTTLTKPAFDLISKW